LNKDEKWYRGYRNFKPKWPNVKY